ncbi:transcription factor Adf-1 [Ceratitis capitata]|nr:transcription factor Adf-1 [Ceratitis capitata]
MRETYGPDFDDRLIRLVRDNPAIYDINHEHYRRYQIRVAIWERIASEMRTPSKFLQTKWKNIRYNYLQELKSLETGLANANIRKRRFTEDLSFLRNTAQTYKKVTHINSSYNSSDNDSNSYMYTDPQNTNTFEIIEIEHSDDGTTALEYAEADYSGSLTDVMHHHQIFDGEIVSTPTVNDCYGNQLLTEFNIPTKLEKSKETEPDVTIEKRNKKRSRKASATIENDSANMQAPSTPTHSNYSRPSTPMLTPIVVMGKEEKLLTNGELTLKPVATQAKSKRHPAEITSGAAKRKSMPAPFPVLTPINDPIELYCLSLVDSLRNMPRAERERVKFEFAKILKDAKYKDQS